MSGVEAIVVSRGESHRRVPEVPRLTSNNGDLMFKSFRNPRIALFTLALGSVSLASPDVSEAAHNERSWCVDHCDQVVIDWNLETYAVIKAATGYADPMAATRILAMVHLAIHDAVNAIEPRFSAYAYSPKANTYSRSADAVVAAAVAAHDVLLALFPAQKDLLTARLESSLIDAGHGDNVAQGKLAGAAAAAAVLNKRTDDGSNNSETYTPGTDPGRYRYTPEFNFLAAPHWRSVTPFALRSPSQFRVAPPPSLESETYTKAFNEVKATGSSAEGAERTEVQTEYAAYWYEFSDIGWNRILRNVSRDKPQDLWQRARTFALLNAAIADSYIAGWDSKMLFDFWRPVTAIRLAEEDGNPETTADPNWSPLLVTPPVQDHPSTHSVLGAAAASVLAHAFGDRVRFTMASPTALPHAPSRTFNSFSSAAWENGDSRVRAGLHFRFAVDAGLHMGYRIGQHTVRTMLYPVALFPKR